MIRRILSYLIAIIAITAIGYFAVDRGRNLLAASTPQPERIRTAVVERATIREVIESSGFVEPVLSTEVKSEISGRILQVPHDNGEEVSTGTILAELDPTSLRTEVTEAQRDVQAQSLRVERARRDYERLQRLHENRFTQEKELLDAETDLKIAEIDLEIREARLEKAEENLSKTIIRAPHAGILSDRNVNPGQVIVGATSVNQGTTLMRVNDLSELVITVDINEVDIAKVDPSVTPVIRIDAYPDRIFTGKIVDVARFAVNRNNLRVFPIEIRFESGDFAVSPGVSATVEILVEEVTDVPSIGVGAVFSEEDQTVVYRKAGEKPNGLSQWERVVIETGIRDFERVEIVAGLQPGDEVALRRPPGFNPYGPRERD